RPRPDPFDRPRAGPGPSRGGRDRRRRPGAAAAEGGPPVRDPDLPVGGGRLPRPAGRGRRRPDPGARPGGGPAGPHRPGAARGLGVDRRPPARVARGRCPSDRPVECPRPRAARRPRGGFGSADLVFAETYRTSGVHQVPLEPHACLAWVDGDRWTVETSTQTPFGCREDVASTLGTPRDA
ncbi:Aldehyde oxidase and xanthine dehydrogenase, molybdopterin binding domain protein, partial [mine drainage metagenome]